jgi:hypothetical protein
MIDRALCQAAMNSSLTSSGNMTSMAAHSAARSIILLKKQAAEVADFIHNLLKRLARSDRFALQALSFVECFFIETMSALGP